MVISDTNIGGAGKWIAEYFRYADHTRFTVKAVIPRGSLLKELYEKVNLPVIECDGIADTSFHPRGVKHLHRIFRREKPHIVHAHGTMSARVAASLPFSGVKKIVYTRHSVFEPEGFFTTFPGKVLNRILTACTSHRILSVCEAAKKNLTDTGIPADKISVVYNGVDAITPPTPSQKEEARHSFGILENEIVCSISARLNPVKGHACLIEAIHQMNSCEGMKFLIAGTGSEEESLKQQVRDYQLEDKVIFTGFLSDVSGLLYATDVLLNCSYGTEACSLAILEAFSLGIPCVASTYGGNPELVKHGQNGWLFPTQDVKALKQTLELVKQNPRLISEYGDAARKTYETGFTVQIMAKNIEKVYEELINE